MQPGRQGFVAILRCRVRQHVAGILVNKGLARQVQLEGRIDKRRLIGEGAGGDGCVVGILNQQAEAVESKLAASVAGADADVQRADIAVFRGTGERPAVGIEVQPVGKGLFIEQGYVQRQTLARRAGAELARRQRVVESTVLGRQLILCRDNEYRRCSLLVDADRKIH